MTSRIPSINEHKAAQSDALKNKVNAEYNQSQQTEQPQQTAVELQPQAMEQPIQQPLAQPTSVPPVAPAKPLNTIPSVDSDPSNGLTVGKPYEHLSWEDFSKRRAEFGNVSDKEFWSGKIKKDPNSTYAILQEMFASDETPEQKRKRERSEQLGEVFRNLGNVIGNAANLYYTHRGGQYIDLNTANEKHRERLQKLKDKQAALKEKQDAMLIDARLADFRYERDKADREAQQKRDDDIRKATWDRQDKQRQEELDYRKERDAVADERYKSETEARQAQQEEDNRQWWAQFGFNKEIYKNSLASSGSGGGKGNGKQTNHGQMKYKYRDGKAYSQTYDLNKDSDVARAYNEGVRLGYLEGIPAEILDKSDNKIGFMRDYLKTQIGKRVAGIPGDENHKSTLNYDLIPGKELGWGKQSSNDNVTDW